MGHYERALEALELKKQIDEERQCELLLALGDAQTKAGSTTKARETLHRAANNARKRGASEQLAGAALGIGGGAVMGTQYGRVDSSQSELIQVALNALGGRDSALRARLLAQLSLALYYSGEKRMLLSQEAVEMARRVEDKPARLAALYSRCISLEGFEKAEERLGGRRTEIVQVAREAGDKEMALRGHYRCLRELLEPGKHARGGQRA